MLRQMTLMAVPGIPDVHHGDDVGRLIIRALEETGYPLGDGDVVVVAQKIVSKAEGRKVALADVTPSPEALEWARRTRKDPRLVELILRESNQVLRARPGLMIVEHRLGFVCANAGIDHSNVCPGNESDEWVLLLPEDPDRSAERIRETLRAHFGVDVAVLIADSHGRAWRLGAVGTAIGVAGMCPLMDLRGRRDLYGRPLRVTRVGTADGIAAAAALLMGEADEGTPVVIVRGAPHEPGVGRLADILRPRELDLFR
ncbi:MAG TPA: coenzyme F420-0:L-glutamate ligase [Caldilineae bacterium]|nr:coenzyme F420-0:L-glutamate ligase [Caldilineae bacterium]